MRVDICELVEKKLVESGGSLEALTPEEKTHLESCDRCRAVAEQERFLAELFSQLPAYDFELERRIIEEAEKHRSVNMLWAVLPFAASFLAVAVGLAMLGGVPAVGLAASVPRWAGAGFNWLTSLISSWYSAMGGLLELGKRIVPGSLAVGFALASVLLLLGASFLAGERR